MQPAYDVTKTASAGYLVFLQNAWSPVYAGGTWPRRSWLRALERSRSGQRLRYLIDNYDLCENTTPIVGATPSSVVAPDMSYIAEILVRRKPDLVVACGKQAEMALTEIWTGSLIVIPHPAHRLVTNELFIEANYLMKTGFQGRVKLKQLKFGIEQEQIK